MFKFIVMVTLYQACAYCITRVEFLFLGSGYKGCIAFDVFSPHGGPSGEKGSGLVPEPENS